MVVSWFVLPVVLLALSAGCGLAVLRASGDRLAPALTLPVGMATMIVVASAATASAGTASLAPVLVLALAVTGVLVAADRRAAWPGRWPALAALGVYVVYGAPVLFSGEPTFTGYIKLDDIATWFAMTDRVMEQGRDVTGLPPSTYEATLSSYIPGGYPVGAFLPLGLGEEFTGRDVAWLFQPTMALVSGLLALTICVLVQGVVTSARAGALVAFLAAQSALLFAYAQWGAIKEVVAALLVALVAALAPTLAGPARGVLPLAVALAALAAALSVGGAVWAAPVVLVALVAGRARVGALVRTLPALAVVAAVLAIPSLLLASTFLRPQLMSGSVLSAVTELGNLRGPLGFDHVLGIWPAGDFRSIPDQKGVTTIALVLASLAGAAGLALAWHRRAAGLVGYVVGGLVACLALIQRGSPWVDAKAMATASPMILTAALALLAALATRRSGHRAPRIAAGSVLAVLGAGVLWSNALGYGQSYLAPRDQLVELERAGELLAGQGPTLMTEYEPYGARHFLRKAEAESASELRRRVIPLRDGTQLPKSASADITAFDPTALREYRSLVLRTSPITSRPPSAYSRIRKGDAYDVWQRPAAPGIQPVGDLPLGAGNDPAAVPTCQQVRDLAAQAGPNGSLVSVERREPAAMDLATVAYPPGWTTAGADTRVLYPSGSGTQELRLRVPADAVYTVWLGGSTRGRTTVSVDGKEVGSLRGRLNNQGGMLRFGELRLTAGAHRVAIAYDDGGLRPGTKGQEEQPLPLGPLVLAPDEGDLAPVTTPSGQATQLCGKRLDWIEARTEG